MWMMSKQYLLQWAPLAHLKLVGEGGVCPLVDTTFFGTCMSFHQSLPHSWYDSWYTPQAGCSLTGTPNQQPGELLTGPPQIWHCLADGLKLNMRHQCWYSWYCYFDGLSHRSVINSALLIVQKLPEARRADWTLDLPKSLIIIPVQGWMMSIVDPSDDCCFPCCVFCRCYWTGRIDPCWDA